LLLAEDFVDTRSRVIGGLAMSRWIAILLLTTISVPATAAKKVTGTTTLKDLQPAGTTDTKDKKNQQYDFIFEVSGNSYTCRTSPKKSLKATDFVVGSDVKYEIEEDEGKLKTAAGKQVKCTVVRVEKLSAPRP
jgi:hypothetical protein